MNKLNRSAYLIIISMGLSTIASIFIETFFVAKILMLSDYNVLQVGIFFVVAHLFLGSIYFLLSPLVKRIKRKIFMCVGVLLRLVEILLIVLLNDNILNYIVLFAAIEGISESIYWLGANVLKAYAVKHELMKTFITYISILKKIVSIVFPIILAYCIEQFSFQITSVVIMFVSFLQIILVAFIKEEEIENKQTLFREFVAKSKQIGYFPIVKKTYFSMFLRGLKNNTVYIITYLTILVYNSNISLGLFTTIISVLSIMAMYLYNIFSKNQKVNMLTTICAVVASLSIALVAFLLNETTLIVFNILFTLAVSIIDNINESRRFNLTKHMHFEKYTIENQAMSEVC